MPQFHSDAATAAGRALDTFTAAYIVCIYFTETGDGDQPDSEIELAPMARENIVEDCAAWQEKHADLLSRAYECVGYDAERAGHDYWYTRNGHGVGFWCRDELPEDLQQALTEAAKEAGEAWVQEGDDKLLHY